MRLFSAVVPPAAALDELDTAVRQARAAVGELRWIPQRSWHVTLCFYGEDDPEARAAWLGDRLAAAPARPLSLTGSGTFPGVLWVGVSGELADLASAAGADDDPRPYHPHLTLARWRRDRGRRAAAEAAVAAESLASFRGAAWQVAEVVLIRSELSRAGARYAVHHRHPLTPPRE